MMLVFYHRTSRVANFPDTASTSQDRPGRPSPGRWWKTAMLSSLRRKSRTTTRPVVEALDERVVPATGGFRGFAVPFVLQSRAPQFFTFGAGTAAQHRAARAA